MALGDVLIRTQVTPDISLHLAGQEGGAKGQVLDLIKPQFQIDTGVGVVNWAPYGTPTSNFFWVVVIALTVLVFFAIRGIK